MESPQPNRIARALSQMTGSVRPWRSAALFALAGLVAILASLLPGSGIDDSWTRDLLMTVGTSLALFAPLYLLTRTLDSHLDTVRTEARETREQVEVVREETAAATAEVRSNFETLRADVERRLGDVAQQVAQRLDAEAEADASAFAALRTSATRATVLEALERADRLGLTALSRPPRVNVGGNTRIYVSAQFDPSEVASEPLMLRVEETNGTVADWIEWPEGTDETEVLVEVGLAIRRHTGENFAAETLFLGLADLLEAALTSTERRVAVELCPPQWMVCDWGVVTYGRGRYGVSLDQLRTSDTIVQHVHEKPWVDNDAWDDVVAVALELFPDPLAAWKAIADGLNGPPT